MARRRSRKNHSNGGMFGGLRRSIKTVAGAAVGVTGLFIAASPAITAVSGATGGGTSLGQTQLANIGPSVAGAYGVNPQSGQVDLGKLITTIVFPVLGGILFIKGMRMIVKHV